MTIDELRNSYRQHPKLIELAAQLKDQSGSRILVKGLHGSSDAFVVANLAGLTQFDILYIASNKEEAAYVLNTCTITRKMFCSFLHQVDNRTVLNQQKTQMF
jgi:predicted NAD/FAD-binding protein